MAYSSRKGKSVAGSGVELPAVRGSGEAVQRFDGGSPAFFIKNIRDGDRNWLADEMKPNLSLISKRLTEMPTGGMGGDWVFSVPDESNKLSTEGIDAKGKKIS